MSARALNHGAQYDCEASKDHDNSEQRHEHGALDGGSELGLGHVGNADWIGHRGSVGGATVAAQFEAVNWRNDYDC